jgi:hypothetical protein
MISLTPKQLVALARIAALLLVALARFAARY